MIGFWCLVVFIPLSEVEIYEGTLTLETWEGRCQERQRVVLMLRESESGLEGYLGFQDKRLAKVAGSAMSTLRLRFPAADSMREESWSLSLGASQGVLQGQIQGVTFESQAGCRVKTASLIIEISPKQSLNFESSASEFEAWSHVKRVWQAIESGDGELALREAGRALQLGTGLEAVHRAAAAVLQRSEKAAAIADEWFTAAAQAERQGKASVSRDYRLSVATIFGTLGDRAFEQKNLEVALNHYRQAIFLVPDHHPYLAKAGEICARLQRDEEAVFWFQEAVSAALSRLDENPERRRKEIATFHAVISAIRNRQPDWEKAEEQKASRLPDTPEMKGHLKAWQELNNQVGEAFRQGQIQRAIQIAEKGYQLALMHFRENHPHTLTALNNLAVLNESLGAYDKAQTFSERVLEQSTQLLGACHTLRLITLNNLGGLNENQASYDAARTYYEEARSLSAEVLGERHPITMGALNNLASLHQTLGEYEAARHLLEQVLERSTEALGAYHSHTWTALNNLALLYQNQGAYDTAYPLLGKALDLSDRVWGEHHPNTLISLNNLSGSYMHRGEYDYAQILYKQVLALFTEVKGPRHPDTLTAMSNLAGSYSAQGDFQEAQPLYKKALSVRTEALGECHPDTWASMDQLAVLYQSQGNYGEAHSLYAKVLALRTEMLGERHPDTLGSMSNLGSLYQSRGLYDQAKLFLERCLVLRAQELGEEHPHTLNSMNNLGALYEYQGLYYEAQSLYERVLWLRLETPGEAHPDTLRSMNNLANLYQRQAAYGQAKSMLERALELSRRVLGERHPSSLTTLDNLASLLESQGVYDRAQLLYERALAFRDRKLGKRHPDTLRSLNNLALFSQKQGAFNRAQSLYERAMDLYKKVLGERHPGTLTVLTNFASLYERQGAYDRAQPLYERACALREQVLGERHPDTLSSYHNLAGLYLNQGAYDQARALYERTLELCEQVLGERHPKTISTLNNLALLYETLKDYDEAQPRFERALALFEQVLGTFHPETLAPRSSLGLLYLHRKDFARAQPLLEQVRALSEQVWGEIHPATVNSLNNLAFLYESQGAYDRAQPLYECALEHSEQLFGRHHPLTLVLLQNLAVFHASIGQNEFAETYFFESAEASRQYLSMLRRLDARTRRTFLNSQYGKSRAAFLSFFSRFQSAEAGGALCSFSLARKGLLFHIGADLGEKIRGLATAEKWNEQVETIEALRRQAAYRAIRLRFGATGERDEMNRILARLDSLERSLINAVSESEEEQPIHLDSVLGALEAGEVLIDFHVFEFYDFEENRFMEERLTALIVDPVNDPVIRQINFGPTAPIYQDLKRLHGEMTHTSNLRSVRKAGQNLFKKLWQPLVLHLDGKDRVYIIPDGAINLLPWSALADEDGNWLTTTVNIAILSTAEDLLAPDPKPTPKGTHYLIYEPDYHLGLGEEEKTSPFVPLTWSRLEGQTLEAFFKERGLQFVTISGAAATEDRVSKIRSPSLLHIATHGLYTGDDRPTAGGTRGIFQAQFDNAPGQEWRPFELLPGERPLLASGLALAGANGVVKGGLGPNHTDGILSGLEVLSMDLYDTNLVVLSACGTGVGTINQGDGVYSLNRSFLEAGARNVLSTLWAVDDEATAAFMRRFYEHYLNGNTPHEALRLTRHFFIGHSPWDHPYYWAPFVLVGRK